MTHSRRSFLAYSGGSLALVAAGGLGFVSVRDRLRRNLILDLLDGTGDTAPLAAVGRAYLLEHPDEGQRPRLLELLGAADGGLLTPNRDRMDAVENGIDEDVDARRFVAIDGWMLTRTEARLYALAAVP